MRKKSGKRQEHVQNTEKINEPVKKILKGPIKYDITLNEEQKLAKAAIHSNTITIVTGKAGSGKTLLACAYALDELFKKQIGKIYITRPTVTREAMGFLPGDISQKLDPFLIPIYENLKQLYSREATKIDNLLRDKTIEIAPIAYMRGRTFTNSVLIIDEAQNMDDESLKMCLTRLGINSKIILCGDCAQIDLKTSMSGLKFLISLKDKIKGFEVVDLKTNHRHPILDEILKFYDEQQKS